MGSAIATLKGFFHKVWKVLSEAAAAPFQRVNHNQDVFEKNYSLGNFLGKGKSSKGTHESILSPMAFFILIECLYKCTWLSTKSQ